MKAYLENPIWLLTLTFLLYFGSLALQKKYKTPWLNPLLITTGLLIGYLLFFNITYEQYEKGGIFIEFWLKPSIVALGVPLYLQMERIKKQIIPLVLSQLAGSSIGIISVCAIAKWLGASREIMVSLAPKSVTTPIAIEISQGMDGIVPLTASAVILTGILGAVIGLQILKHTRIHSSIGQGISLGTASHGLGVMAAMGLSPKYAAFASLGLILNGIFTAILAPPLVNLLF